MRALSVVRLSSCGCWEKKKCWLTGKGECAKGGRVAEWEKTRHRGGNPAKIFNWAILSQIR